VAPGLPRLKAWIEGMFAQASDPVASARTRPFIVNIYRLMDQYPDEHKRSINALVELVDDALAEAYAAKQISRKPTPADATSIYHLTVSPMETHIALSTKPTRAEIAAVVDFARRALTGGHTASPT